MRELPVRPKLLDLRRILPAGFPWAEKHARFSASVLASVGRLVNASLDMTHSSPSAMTRPPAAFAVDAERSSAAARGKNFRMAAW